MWREAGGRAGGRAGLGSFIYIVDTYFIQVDGYEENINGVEVEAGRGRAQNWSTKAFTIEKETHKRQCDTKFGQILSLCQNLKV